MPKFWVFFYGQKAHRKYLLPFFLCVWTQRFSHVSEVSSCASSCRCLEWFGTEPRLILDQWCSFCTFVTWSVCLQSTDEHESDVFRKKTQLWNYKITLETKEGRNERMAITAQNGDLDFFVDIIYIWVLKRVNIYIFLVHHIRSIFDTHLRWINSCTVFIYGTPKHD